MVLEKLDLQETEVDRNLIPVTYSVQIMTQNKSMTYILNLKLLEGNTRKYIKIQIYTFFSRISNTQAPKVEIDKWNYFKLKKFSYSKGNHQYTVEEDIFIKQISDQRLMSRTYKEPRIQWQ